MRIYLFTLSSGPFANIHPAIAVPMGMGSKEYIRTILSSMEVIEALASAEKMLWEHLRLTSANGNVVKIREAAISLVLVSAFRTSLGDKRADGASVMVGLLGMFWPPLSLKF